MSTIVTRYGKGSPLTWLEVDDNFTNLNTDKIQSGNTVASLTITSATINGGSINSTTVGASTASSGAFTTLSASSTVSGTGFSTYLASPPAIGGTAPAAGAFTTLSATGVTTVQAGTVSLPAITTTGDTNTGIFFPAADTIAFTEGGAEAMRINSSGNVGIGTTAPLSRLNSVASNAAAVTALTLNNSNSGFAADEAVDIDFGVGSSVAAAHGKLRVGNTTATVGSSSYMSFYTRAADVLAEKMRIDSAGNVGIGTSSPTTSLDVRTGTNPTILAKTTGSGYAAVNIDSSTTATQGYLFFNINGTEVARLTANASNYLTFATGSSATERMRIDSAGNVGIGTSSPAVKLDVSGNALAFNHYVGNGNSTFSTSDGANGMIVYGSAGSGATNSVGFYSNATERMRIDSSGNVGIGSTNPSAYGKLTVDGAIAQVAAAGSYTIDITANTIAVANGGTISFPNMSGMIIVNSVTSASIAIWLVSGGSTSAVSDVNGATGTMTYVAGIAGYRWTNNTGSTNTAAFFCVRTRGTA